MANQPPQVFDKKVRPTLMVGGGNGDTTFVDVDNLHPKNEAVATAEGALAGGLTAGAAGTAAGFALHTKGHTKAGAAVALVTTAAGAAVGGILKRANAKTHNEWAKGVTEKTLDNQSQSQQK